MSYEYGTGQQGLNYPNPYKMENRLLIIRITIFTLITLFLFILAKIELENKQYTNLCINLGIACIFIYLIISSSYILSKQYRVYFGRGQPNGLATELPLDANGTTESANKLKDTIRQGALSIQAPQNNMYGFLYSYFKDLIIAPKEIRVIAEHLFSNVIKLSIITFLFLLSSFFAYGHESSGWLGLFFFGITLTIILKPLIDKKFSNPQLRITTFWKLFSFALLVPIGLIFFGQDLPNISHFHFDIQSFVILMVTLIGDLLTLYSLKSQLYEPNAITTAFEQESVNFNAPPSQLNLEIDRRLQQEWTSAIPNRIYSNLSPNIPNIQTGVFKGQVIQENQPMVPTSLMEEQTFHSIINNSRLYNVFLIDLFSLGFTLIASVSIFIILLKLHMNPDNYFGSAVWLPTLFGMLSLSSYWIKIAHELWGRFDFTSKLYIFEWEGNFSKAKMNFGNQFKDTIHTEKDIVNIESMTLRVWVTHLNTVVFGHGINNESNERRIISMVGLKSEAKNWIQHLKSFAESQSMMLKPNAREDFIRAAELSQLNSLSGYSEHNNLEKNKSDNVSEKMKGLLNNTDLENN